MKLISYILFIMLLNACVPRNINYREDAISSFPTLDTLFVANDYLLIFENTDIFEATDIYDDYTYRKQLTDTVALNYFERANVIQTYLSNRFDDYFYTTDSTVVLRLKTGKTISFFSWDKDKEVGYIFEHYFEKIDYYLLIVQYFEGYSRLLVNRKNGYNKSINGTPYISNDNKKIISINSDISAGYNFNGIELYTILGDSIKTEFSKKTEWSPIAVKWINENEFLLKRECLAEDIKVDYKRVFIKKDTLYDYNTN